EVLAGTATEPLWSALTEFTDWPQARLSLKANLLPGRVAAWCLAASRLPEGPYLDTHAGSGNGRAHPGGGWTAGRAGEMLKELTALVGEEGNVIVPRCPTGWKQTLPIWGRPRGDDWLMRQVKEKLDPGRLFNPGRFAAGI